MKVADLFAALRLRVDASSFKAGDRLIKGIKRDAAGLFSGMRGNILGIAGAVGIVQTATNALNTDEALGRLNAASRQGLGDMGAFHDRILDVSDDTGILTEELTSGIAKFISLTGNVGAATKSLETFGKVNVATGATMVDIASSAAAMSQTLGILPEQFERGFAILESAGLEGAVEIKDAAGLLARLTPVTARFEGGKGLAGLASTIAALNLVRQVSGTAKQATTRLEAVLGSIVLKAKVLEKAGVSVFNVDDKGVKTLKAAHSIIIDIANSKLVQDPTALSEALGSKEAETAFIGLSRLKGEWNAATESALAATNVNVSFGIRTSTASFKVRKALNKVRNTFARLGAFMIKVFAGIIDHIDLVIVLFSSLIITMVILKAAAVGAAIASGAAWVVAFSPVILIVLAVTAAIAAVILILEDLFGFLTGKKSVLGDFVDLIFGVGTAAGVADSVFKAWKFTIASLGKAWDDVMDAFSVGFKGLQSGLEAGAKGMKDALLTVIDTLGDMLDTVLNLVSNLDEIQIALGLKDAPKIDNEAAEELFSQITTRDRDSPSRPIRRSSREAPIGGSNTDIRSNITINVANPVNGDADATATTIGDTIQNVIADLMRDTSEQTGR